MLLICAVETYTYSEENVQRNSQKDIITLVRLEEAPSALTS